jgi:hypothetical protein
MEQESHFILPNSPEEFGVLLPLPELRRIDFSALEFTTLQRALIEYMKSYYPTFNDFTPQNGVMMLIDLIAYVGSVLSLRSDILADESFLPTAQTIDAVINHLELIGQKMNRPTPAVVDLECSISEAAQSEIRIPSGIVFNLRGADGAPLTYELYRAPGDFTNPITIPPGKRGVIGFAIEGLFATPVIATSAGGPSQTIDLISKNILDDPIFVDITSGNTIKRWRRVNFIETADATDEVYEVKFFEDKATVVFGDDVHGKAPLAGQIFEIRYRIGGGIRGRIGAGLIRESRPISPQPPFTAAVDVTFRNLNASSGGVDGESIEDAKRRAPREYATHGNAVSDSDYAHICSQFSHPVFGSVLKAVATIRTSLNANLVEAYVLAQGPGNVPVAPSAGLKKGLITYLEERNVLTDEVRVMDGAIKPVDVQANVVMAANADAGTVKEQVNAVIDNFFSINNFDMGQGLYYSQLLAAMQQVDGVQFVDMFKPSDDILPTKKIADPINQGVGFNELITIGNKKIRFYFEKGRYN